MSTKREVRGASARLVTAAVACVLVVLALVLRSADGPRSRAEGEQVAPAPVAPATPTGNGGEGATAPRPHQLELPPRSADDAPRAVQATEKAAPRPPRHDFDGHGVIRGEVVAAPGVVFPQVWTLVIEPHPFLEGRERAALRRIEFTRGEREFAVTDLPLAGYLVRAVARDLNNVPADVLLVRGSPDQFVTTKLQRAGFVDGTVLTHAGTPAEGLEVTLESSATHERRTVLADAAGHYRIDDVVDGSYTLTFGSLEAPLLPVESISFRAPSLRFPERELPPTGTLKLRTLDVGGRPLPDTHVFARAEPRGSFDLRSDQFANAHARHLWPGRYRIEAATEDRLRADIALDIEAGTEHSIEIRLQP